MPNGQISVKSAIENELADVEELTPELKCISHLASGFDNLPCEAHAKRMDGFKTWKTLVMGGLIVVGALVGGGGVGLLIAFLKGVL
jgi:hypothetical protein